jgi:hypothetical protein
MKLGLSGLYKGSLFIQMGLHCKTMQTIQIHRSAQSTVLLGGPGPDVDDNAFYYNLYSKFRIEIIIRLPSRRLQQCTGAPRRKMLNWVSPFSSLRVTYGYRHLGYEITHSLALRTHFRRLGATLEALYTNGKM